MFPSYRYFGSQELSIVGCQRLNPILRYHLFTGEWGVLKSLLSQSSSTFRHQFHCPYTGFKIKMTTIKVILRRVACFCLNYIRLFYFIIWLFVELSICVSVYLKYKISLAVGAGTMCLVQSAMADSLSLLFLLLFKMSWGLTSVSLSLGV